MDLIKIDIVGAQSLQTVFHRVHKRFGRQARCIGGLPPGAKCLGRNDDLVAPGKFFQPFAGDRFRSSRRINIGRIEEIDPQLERLADHRARSLFVHRPVMAYGLGIGLRNAEAHTAQTEA